MILILNEENTCSSLDFMFVRLNLYGYSTNIVFDPVKYRNRSIYLQRKIQLSDNRSNSLKWRWIMDDARQLIELSMFSDSLIRLEIA